ncbi:hypothetical protein AB0K35_28170 [Micromonospora sp. NPDC053740]|uniref:hypothetical protein n=1 Tax=Micromonospora sp. NPDC053740 TaxID=3155173 RepID=UPI00342A2907
MPDATPRPVPQPPALDDSARSALTAAYWKLREHASGYRNADVYQRAQERGRTGDANDRKQAAMHRAFARGIEAAGEDIASMLEVPEHEIEPISKDADQ